MTDAQIKELYTTAYCAKNAAALDDFVNWIRQLLGMKRRNSTGENVAATIAGVGAAGGAAYGGYKGYRGLQKLDKLRKYFADYNNIDDFLRKGDQSLSGASKGLVDFNLAHRLSDNKVGRGFSKGMKWLGKMPRWGKVGALVGGAAAAGGIVGKAYDSIFNG